MKPLLIFHQLTLFMRYIQRLTRDQRVAIIDFMTSSRLSREIIRANAILLSAEKLNVNDIAKIYR